MNWWIVGGIVGVFLFLLVEAVVMCLFIRAIANGWPHPRQDDGKEGAK